MREAQPLGLEARSSAEARARDEADEGAAQSAGSHASSHLRGFVSERLRNAQSCHPRLAQSPQLQGMAAPELAELLSSLATDESAILPRCFTPGRHPDHAVMLGCDVVARLSQSGLQALSGSALSRSLLATAALDIRTAEAEQLMHAGLRRLTATAGLPATPTQLASTLWAASRWRCEHLVKTAVAVPLLRAVARGSVPLEMYDMVELILLDDALATFEKGCHSASHLPIPKEILDTRQALDGLIEARDYASQSPDDCLRCAVFEVLCSLSDSAVDAGLLQGPQ